jgi:hypothetical protein
MQIDNNMAPNQLISQIQVDVLKKSEDTTKNLLGKILEDNFENTKKLEEEAAKITGKGMNLNIKG